MPAHFPDGTPALPEKNGHGVFNASGGRQTSPLTRSGLGSISFLAYEEVSFSWM